MEQIAENRFFTMAETYDKMAPIMVPQYDLFQNEVFRIVDFPKDEKVVVLDLGAGSGIFLEKVLSTYPNAICYWIDFSADFLKIAKQRLERFNGRVNFILSPLEKDWEKELDDKPDMVFSMSAIHHLENPEKERLYKRCYNILNPGGWFFNADEMRTIKTDAYRNSLKYWASYVSKSEKKVPDDLMNYYTKFNKHFDNWKLRNIDNFNLPKIKGDDIHENFIEQLKWLDKIGFQCIDAFVKYHLWTMIGGRK